MRAAGWVAILSTALPSAPACGQGDEGGEDVDAAGSAVVRILELSHFSGETLEDVEQKVWVNFADQVDPARIFISEEDISEAREAVGTEGGLRHDIEGGGYSAAKALVDRAVGAGNRFGGGRWGREAPGDAKVPLVWETLPRAKTDGELEDRWRLFLRMKQVRGEAETPGDIAGLGQAAGRLGEAEVRDLFLDAVAAAFDRNSEYQRPYRKDTFAKEMSLESTTTGVEVVREDSGRVVVKESKEGGPETGGAVVGVGVKGGPVFKVEDLSDARLAEMVGGGSGAAAVIELDGGGGEVRTVEVGVEDNPANAASRASAELVHLAGRSVGLLSVPALYGWGREDSGGDFRRLVGRLRDAGAEAIVLDLRGNSGGSVDEAREMAGVFVGDGDVALGLDRNGDVRSFDGVGEVGFHGPVVCMVDAETGSAAEILAGALQHHGRGVVLGGGPTRGKGTAQAVLDLGQHGYLGVVPDAHLGAVRVSTMLLYTPGGKAIQGRGIWPDIVVPCGMLAARAVSEMKGVSEVALGDASLDGLRGGQMNLEQSESLAAASALSRNRVEKNPFFLKTRELLSKVTAALEGNYAGREAGEDIRSLYRAMVEGRTPSREFVSEDVTGPGRGDPGGLLLDPYASEAVSIAIDLAAAGALPPGAKGVESAHAEK